MNIAIYARKSPAPRTKEDKDGNIRRVSVDSVNQILELESFIQRKSGDGWIQTHKFVDDYVSGKSGDRPQFKEMFKAASRKEFDILLFWSLDRFSREGVLETLQYLQRLTSYQVEWYSFTEEYLRSIGMFRDAILAILAAIAKQERIRSSERTIAGLTRARAEGKILGRPKVVVDKLRVKEDRAKGFTYTQLSEKYKIGFGTAQRICKLEIK